MGRGLRMEVIIAGFKQAERSHNREVLAALSGVIWMSKRVICSILYSIVLVTGCTFSAQQTQTGPTKTSAERLTVQGLSQDIIADARQTATAHCSEQDRQFTFLRNICRKKSLLGIEWLTCDLYFACTAEGEQPPTLPAIPAHPDEIITDKADHPGPQASDAAKNAPPDDGKQPAQSAASLPTKNLDPYGVGELESLGPEPLGPGDSPACASDDQGITEEILR